MKIDLGKNELIHFVGIGGIGMSGLALIMNGLGYKVQGSDIANNRNIERLREKKIRIFLNQKKSNIKKTTILVTSSAIKKNNPEVLEAKKKNCCWLIMQKDINENNFINLLNNIFENQNEYFSKKNNLIQLTKEDTWEKNKVKLTKLINEN